LTPEAAREKVGFEIPMPMPIAALRDPASETLIVARDARAAAAARDEGVGHAVTGLGDHLQAEARHPGAIHAALERAQLFFWTSAGAVFFTSRFGGKIIADHIDWRAS
jgi:hypothetical protein